MRKGFTKTRHSDEQSEEESNKRNRSFAVAQDDRLREGFTLVELSIVLVIIGLLISGLLVGQSMITSTKVQAQVKQFQQFDIAVENFKTMYGQLPGDTEFFTLGAGAGCGASAGDNDGTVEDSNDDLGSTVTLFDCEVAGFWDHLSQNGFGNISFSGNGASGVWQDEHAPKLKLGDGLSVAYGVSGTNYYQAYDHKDTNADLDSGTNEGAFLASEALAIDSKMDDAVANTGDVVAMGDSDEFLFATTNAAAGSAGCVITGNLGTYNVTYSSAEICQLRVNMLSQTTD